MMLSEVEMFLYVFFFSCCLSFLFPFPCLSLFNPPAPFLQHFLPRWLSHISPALALLLGPSPLPLSFQFLVPLTHKLCLDSTQRDGASVLMNNNRNWEKEKVRTGSRGKLSVWLALSLSLYLPDCQQLCVSVSVMS